MQTISKIIKTRFIHFCKLVFFVCISLPALTIKAQSINDSVFNASTITNFQLHDVATSKSIFLKADQSTQKKLILFVFLSPECPLCQNYSGTLNSLYNQYFKSISLYGIIPGRAYSVDIIKKFKEQYNIQFPLFIDSNKKLTEYLQASVTPQVILFNTQYQLVYKGAIDNWLQALGKQRIKPTAYFLQDALQQSLSNKTVLVKRTKAVGCRINDY